MMIPSFPVQNPQFVNKDGTLHNVNVSFFTQLTRALQDNLSHKGYLLPAQTTSNIAELEPLTVGRILYNSDTKKMSVNNTGKFKEVYSRPEQMTSTEIAAIPTADINGTWVFNTTTNKLLYGINDVFREVAFT